MSHQENFYMQKLEFEIDSWDLNEAIKNGENITVVDARSGAAYKSEHISGSVSLPYREMSEGSTGDWNRKVLYVTYCDGIGCNASTKAALNLTKLGFRVKELIGGIEWWKRDGYPTSLNQGQDQNQNQNQDQNKNQNRDQNQNQDQNQGRNQGHEKKEIECGC